jgi:FlaA1/EpsC-like NDP-sugar epimerase
MKGQQQWALAIFSLSRWKKRVLMVLADIVMMALAVWLGYAIRLGDLQPDLEGGVWLLLLAPLLSIPVFIHLGLYRAVIRYIGSQALVTVTYGALLSTLLLALSVMLFRFQGVPRSLVFIYFGLVLLLVGGSRYLVRYYYYFVLHQGEHAQRIAIYGAGQSGMQLAQALKRGRGYSPVFFVDDNPVLQGTVMEGLPVAAPGELAKLIEQYGVGQVLLAMPSVTQARRREILSQLEHLPVHVRSIPGMAELLAGKRSIDDLHEIDIDDLLGRIPVAPDHAMIEASLQGKRLMVTGAGGSIGSELCRQMLKFKPRVLILLEMSEHALYQVERELRELNQEEGYGVKLVPVLGSVRDESFLVRLLHAQRVQTVYHAAAYKHVPLVEVNPFEGVLNNTLGTLACAQAATAAGVERFVLISTDKAVRPTNVMGASKRLAEKALQGLSTTGGSTIYSMVRFGNVLGSSGSVVPLFRQQIEQGGPITVTHPDVIRYFMSIPEAAQLVLQAGAMAHGGEIFLLDMGEPVRIVDLARRMIKLSGNKVAGEFSHASERDGSIAIAFSGLRPGEKLYEELLISGEHRATAHPHIRAAEEAAIEWNTMAPVFAVLEEVCKNRDEATLRALLMRWVEGCQLTVAENEWSLGD